MEDEGQFVSFEWIGLKDYLGENRRRNERTRGANSTSADAAIMFERADRGRQIVLIEWKYTESYSPISLKIAKSGTDRTQIYAPLFSRDNCPLNKEILPRLTHSFSSPSTSSRANSFWRMRWKRQWNWSSTVSVLHIAPVVQCRLS